MTARAAAHFALAQGGSRLALYDLRETIETAKQPLAVKFMAAVTAIGDATCLEPIAAAHAKKRPRADERATIGGPGTSPRPFAQSPRESG